MKSTSESLSHPETSYAARAVLADSDFDFLAYQFKRSQRGKMMRLVRPKSLRKLRESIKPRRTSISGTGIPPGARKKLRKLT